MIVTSPITYASHLSQAERLATNFKHEVGIYGEGEIPVREMVEKLMKDTEKAKVEELPHICSPEWEYNLSSIFVQVDTPLVIFFSLITGYELFLLLYGLWVVILMMLVVKWTYREGVALEALLL